MDSTPFNKVSDLPIPLNTQEVAHELRFAIAKLTAFRLHSSAKWAGELLLSIADAPPPAPA